MNRAQRRAQLKKRQRQNDLGATANRSVDWVWRGSRDVPREDREMDVPGVNCPPLEPEFEAQVNRNLWHERTDIDSFVSKIKELSEEESYEWCWSRNSSCKYINFRFDMRDGGFILTNDKGKRINLAQLQWQWKSAKGVK